MSRAFNFSAGPAALPEPVLRRAQAEMLEWGGARASVMEVSHRGQDFVECAATAEAALRRLLSVPNNYRVLFLQGGATQHFAQIPMNLAHNRSTDYIVTGHWGEKAVAEARKVCAVRVVASSVDDAFRSIPDLATADFDPDAAYVHYTPNETIHGVEFHHVPEVGHAPLIADASSTILSRPLDVSRFGLIYAGAQKNIGPSGLVLLIVREDLLDRAPESLPAILRYRAQAENDSMLNTPNTFAWYLAGLVFEWLEGEGGLTAIGMRNQRKADLLYAAID
ncbi:MAG: 3-phosphoserine/phosphohydroxythreonine transaminase, partial [Lysobacterales bacterium]